MARTNTLGNFLTDVAEAIRTKKGTSETIQASQFDTEIANLPSGSDLDWSAIGYDSTPQSIVDGYNYAKYIQENWVDETSKLSDFKNVVISPQLSLGNRTNLYGFARYLNSLLEIPLLDTSSVTTMSYMFESCYSLATIPLLDTSSVTDMQSMFSSCSMLTTIPLLNTSRVTNMVSMFSSCRKLTTIPLLDTSSVTTMSSMFLNCSSLATIPLLDTSNVTNMYDIFHGCTNLTTVPLLNTSSVTGNMNNMFAQCSKLSNESLDNILQMCINATAYTGTKTLYFLGLRSSYYSVSKIQALPHYQDFIDAGWTIGY
jgi:surface protein